MTEDPRFASTLARGLSVLRAFRVTDDGLSNAEIAARTGLPKSTVSRLTFTLGQLGYVVQSPRDGRFRPGPTLVAVGEVAGASLSFLTPAQALMEDLAAELGMLIVLAVRDGDKMVLIRTWRPHGVASIWLEVGQRIPMQPYSSWRGLVAAATKAELEAIAKDRPTGDPDLAGVMAVQAECRVQLAQRGFIWTPAGDSPAAYDAVSVPFRSGNLAEPVVFTAGVLPQDAPCQMREIAGPRLAAAVRSLETLTGRSGGPIAMEPDV